MRWTRGAQLAAAAAAGLAVATVLAYWGVWRHGFVVTDDPAYVFDQPMVQDGLTSAGIRWAFTTMTAANYHPLTWLSYMLDCQLFGVNAAAHHTINLILHIANTILLLVVFTRMTGDVGKSTFVAGVFALHPLHVESVAWIAERKDLLSTFFGLLAILAHAAYARNSTAGRYLAVAAFLTLGLLTKPMLVTLPFVLLLLDIWPLGRSTLYARAQATAGDEPMTLSELLLEKLPLLLLCVIASGVTLLAQKHAMEPVEVTSSLARALNALMAYGRYVAKTFWPRRLMFFYPYSFQFALTQLAACALVLAGMTVWAVRTIKRTPYVAVGWFWFLGTLVPVIGLVQVGGQAMADRYMYIPMIGLSIVVAWGAAYFLRTIQQRRWITTPIGAAALIALAVGTHRQMAYWRSSITLANHALSIDPNNWFAYTLLGGGYYVAGDLDRAIEYYEIASRMKPGRYQSTLDALKAEREQKPSRGTS
jgi:protein O-mannosyl-transferase